MTPNELANLKLNGVAVLPGHVENQAGCTGETSQKWQEKVCKIKPLIDKSMFASEAALGFLGILELQ